MHSHPFQFIAGDIGEVLLVIFFSSGCTHIHPYCILYNVGGNNAVLELRRDKGIYGRVRQFDDSVSLAEISKILSALSCYENKGLLIRFSPHIQGQCQYSFIAGRAHTSEGPRIVLENKVELTKRRRVIFSDFFEQ